MNTVSACPDAPALRAYLLGQTPEASASAVEEHVSSCHSCKQRLPELEAEDDFVADFRVQAAQPHLPNTLADRIAGNLYDLIRQPEGSSMEATLGSDDGITPPPHAAGQDTEELGSFLAPPQEPDELGRLGTYRILRKLGAGGMGMVFLAEDTQLRRKVALKTMLPRFAKSKQARERFLREGRAAAAIEYPHIVAIYQVGEDNGVPYLAMPYLKGQSLEDRLQQERPLPEAEALRIAAEMADGLAAAHAQGLIHRDIKPGNVWLETPTGQAGMAAPGGHVKLLDFGLARAKDDNTNLTDSGIILGTPAFMAPEQARSENIDGRADLFSLGCVLYLMLTGQRPFQGQTTMNLLSSLALDTPPEPNTLNPTVSPAVNELTMRLLAKKPEDRLQTARETAEELRRLLEKKNDVLCFDTAPRIAPVKPRKRFRWAVAAGLLFTAALLAAIVIIIRDKYSNVVLSVEVVKDKSSQIPPVPGPNLGEPLYPTALVARPAKLPGVLSWTIETIGHRTGVPGFHRIAWSRDGKRLATVDGHRIARIWDSSTGQLERMLVGPGDDLVGLSADGKKLFWCALGEKGHFAIQEVSSGRIRSFPITRGTNHLTAVSLSPDEKTFVVAPGRIYNVEKGDEIDALDLGIITPGFSPDGKLLASVHPNKDGKPEAILQIRSVDTFKLLHQFPIAFDGWNGDYYAYRFAWSRDGKSIALRNNSSISILDSEKGTVLRTITKGVNDHPYWQYGVSCLSPDWSKLAVHTWPPSHTFAISPVDGNVQPKILEPFRGNQTDEPRNPSWSPDGKHFAAFTGPGSGYATNTLLIWDVSDGKLTLVRGNPQGNGAGITWLADGSGLLFYKNNFEPISRWDPSTGKLLPCSDTEVPSPNGRFKPSKVEGICFANAAWSQDGTVSRRNLNG